MPPAAMQLQGILNQMRAVFPLHLSSFRYRALAAANGFEGSQAVYQMAIYHRLGKTSNRPTVLRGFGKCWSLIIGVSLF